MWDVGVFGLAGSWNESHAQAYEAAVERESKRVRCFDF